MDETARSLSTLASDTNERVGVVASASDEASANVQTVAATAEELAVSVGEIGTRVSTASRIVSQVTENARTANLKVEGLATAAQRIGDVVSLIQDVAAPPYGREFPAPGGRRGPAQARRLALVEGG
jgi:methyl-accepting chemotaxis protein